MSRTIGATTVDYVWDLSGGLPNVLEDSQGNRYVYGLSRIARINGSTGEYYLADGLGSTTALTDDTGSVADTYEYDIFGNVRAETGSSTNEFTYTGEQNESTGLEYLRARYYDPATGRFISEDPLPLMQRYAYVGNSPANYTDPSGLFHGSFIPPIPIPPIPPIVIAAACALSSDCRSDVADFVDNVANNPGSVIQDTAGLVIARGSFGDRFERDGAVFYADCWGICSLFRLSPNATNITIGNFVFSRGDPSERTIQHELTHVQQGDRYGLAWAYQYFSEAAQNGYRCNRFEVEAREAAGEPKQCYE